MASSFSRRAGLQLGADPLRRLHRLRLLRVQPRDALLRLGGAAVREPDFVLALPVGARSALELGLEGGGALDRLGGALPRRRRRLALALDQRGHRRHRLLLHRQCGLAHVDALLLHARPQPRALQRRRELRRVAAALGRAVLADVAARAAQHVERLAHLLERLVEVGAGGVGRRRRAPPPEGMRLGVPRAPYAPGPGEMGPARCGEWASELRALGRGGRGFEG